MVSGRGSGSRSGSLVRTKFDLAGWETRERRERQEGGKKEKDSTRAGTNGKNLGEK